MRIPTSPNSLPKKTNSRNGLHPNLSNKEPSEEWKESLFRRQLNRVPEMKQILTMYDFQVTQNGQSRSYDTLYSMVQVHLDQKRKNKNRDDMSKQHLRAYPAQSKQGVCQQWAQYGKCSRGPECPLRPHCSLKPQ